MTSDTRILTFLRAAVACDASADGIGGEDQETAWRALTDDERDAVNAYASLAARNVVPEASSPTLPPIGSRFGDLTDEQRAALPVGTVMEWNDDTKTLVGPDEWRFDGGSETWAGDEISNNNVILSYPEAPK